MSEDAHTQLVRLAQLADTADDLFDDPRWDELARGEASEATRSELEQLALEAGVPEAMDAFAPLSPAANARILEAADAAAHDAAGDDSAGDEAAGDDVADDSAGDDAEPVSQRVVSFPGRRVTFIGLAAALAIAALVMLWWRQPDERVAVQWPSYELTLQGGEKVMRSEGEPRSYRAGSRLEVLLRPQRKALAEPAVRAFVVTERAVLPLSGRTKVSQSGALRFTALLPRPLPDGPLSVWLVIGRSEDLPPASADRATLDGLGASVRVMKASLLRASSGKTP